MSLQDLTRLMAVSGRRMPRECSPKSGCARVRLVFDVLGLSRYLRRLERGMWAFVVYPASSRERITMTKNIFRLGLVLALCGAMTACKKSEDAAEKAADAADHAAHEVAEAAEAAGEAAEEAAEKAGEAAEDAKEAAGAAAADVKEAGEKAVAATKEAAADAEAAAVEAKEATEAAAADAKKKTGQ